MLLSSVQSFGINNQQLDQPLLSQLQQHQHVNAVKVQLPSQQALPGATPGPASTDGDGDHGQELSGHKGQLINTLA
nr:hypothetical protein [Bacilli bacterium]